MILAWACPFNVGPPSTSSFYWRYIAHFAFWIGPVYLSYISLEIRLLTANMICAVTPVPSDLTYDLTHKPESSETRL